MQDDGNHAIQTNKPHVSNIGPIIIAAAMIVTTLICTVPVICHIWGTLFASFPVTTFMFATMITHK